MKAIEQLAGRRILFMNWRDLSHPAAGGAEAYAEQIAQRMTRAGVSVTLFTSAYPGAAAFDWSRGYLVLRRRGRFGVYAAAARHLRKYGRQYDAVVDFQNGIPFFAPLWARRRMPVVCVVHHVHQKQFDLYFPWPVSLIGRVLEGRATRWAYRDSALVAVSPSTRAEMRHQLGLRGPIHIVPNGNSPAAADDQGRSALPTISVVTRLVPHKQLHLLVDAVSQLTSRWPELRVTIAGTGESRDALAERVRDRGLDQIVSLPGRVSEQDKARLLARAWLTVAPSLAEGWGLTVLEANAAGTPAVAFDVPGLRDSVRDGSTGWLVRSGADLAAVLDQALTEMADPAVSAAMAVRCRRWAASFDWDSTTGRLAQVLLSELARKEQRRPARQAAVDLATVAQWPAPQADEAEALLRKELRITDVISRDPGGLQLLLSGCDELAAVRVLARIPIPPASLRLATTSEILRGGPDGDRG